MKKPILATAFIVISISFLFSCKEKESTVQYLADYSQRKEIISTIVHSEPYTAELLYAMMNDTACRKALGEALVNDNGMKNLLLNNMMVASNNDSNKCKTMIEVMQAYPNIMKSMIGMNVKSHITPMLRKVVINGSPMQNKLN